MKILALALILFAFSSPMACQERWVNCIGNQSCSPRFYNEPHTLEELRHQINQAALQGQKLHAIGSGYSISDIGCTDGCLLNLKHLKRILSVDAANRRVRVEAGITMQELNERLAEYHLALSNQAAIAQVTLGGALSTGVHGTGHTGTLSSFVREIELITADGQLHKLSDTVNFNAFAAARVGLGSLGVMYAVTLQCEPLFYLKSSTETTTLQQIIENYKQLNASNDFFQFSWDTATDNVLITKWNRCEQNEQCTASYKALPWYTIDVNDKDLFSEIAVPIDLLPNVLTAIKPLVKKYREAGAGIVDINIRFVQQDENALLSPSSNGPVACIAFCMLEEDKYLAFYKEFEEAMYAYQGRPHWGKLNFLDHAKAINLYGANLKKFIGLKWQLDPNGMFSNAFTDRVFGIKKRNSSHD
jgi:L-gulonolactone oxidase